MGEDILIHFVKHSRDVSEIVLMLLRLHKILQVSRNQE